MVDLCQKLLMGVDVGTSYLKLSLFTLNGKKCMEVRKKLRVINPNPGIFEQKPEEIWKKFSKGTKELIIKTKARPENIEAVGVAGHMPSPIPLSRNGDPLTNCLLHIDNRGLRYVNKITEKLSPKEVYTKAGVRPSSSYSATKYLWLKYEQPDRYHNVYKFVEPASFVTFKLTDSIWFDETHAAGTMLFDIHKRRWNSELISLLNLDLEKLPDTLSSTQLVGEVTSKASKATGLMKGTPVTVGVADTFAAVFGNGVEGKNILSNISGTTECLNIVVDKVVLDKQMRFSCYPFIIHDKWVLDAAFASGILVNEFLKIFFKKAPSEKLYSKIDDMLKDTSIGADHMLFYPFIASGEQSPYWDPYSKPVLIGIDINKNIKHIIRAVFEGLTYAVKLNIDAFLENYIDVNQIILSGGGAKNIFWSQMKADVSELPVKISRDKDNTSLGAALIAGLATKIYGDIEDCRERVLLNYTTLLPNIERHVKYMDYYNLFKKIYPSIRGIFRRLNTCK